jgi:hypothetical protein
MKHTGQTLSTFKLLAIFFLSDNWQKVFFFFLSIFLFYFQTTDASIFSFVSA